MLTNKFVINRDKSSIYDGRNYFEFSVPSGNPEHWPLVCLLWNCSWVEKTSLRTANCFGPKRYVMVVGSRDVSAIPSETKAVCEHFELFQLIARRQLDINSIFRYQAVNVFKG